MPSLKQYYFFLVILLVFACKGKPGKEDEKIAGPDTAGTQLTGLLNADSTKEEPGGFKRTLYRA